MVLPPVGYVKELLCIKCLGQTLVHVDAQPVTCGAVVGLSVWQMGGRRLHHLHHLPPSWLNPSKLLALEIWPVEEPVFLLDFNGLKSPINLCFFPSLRTPVLPPLS